MTEAANSTGGLRVSRIIKAPRIKVYQAFLDPEAVAAWLVPDTMRGRVHLFDPREGGQFRISLTYQSPEDSQRGKTSGDTDTYHGRFVELVPNEKIVEGGTEVSLLYENVPMGIRPEDNEAGTRSSLQKLAALVE